MGSQVTLAGDTDTPPTICLREMTSSVKIQTASGLLGSKAAGYGTYTRY